MRVCEVIGEVGEWRTADRSEKAAKAGPAPRVNLVLLAAFGRVKFLPTSLRQGKKIFPADGARVKCFTL